MSQRNLTLLKQVTSLPTAPFAEGRVAEFIRQFVARRPALSLRPDRFGNLLVRYAPRSRAARGTGRPILFAAHMDHPGFVVERMVDASHVLAEFRGWVSSAYFKNERIQFYSNNRWIPAQIEQVMADRPKRQADRRARASAATFRDQTPPRAVIARAREAIAPGTPGMWNFGDSTIRGRRLFARACDDLAGLAAVLAALDEICRRRIRSRCAAFFTRAEEVGFGGALAAVSDRTVPRNAIVVAVECSKAIAGVSFGDGPILRVGDRASVFTPAATAHCQVVAEKLSAKDRSFRIQRKLMDGGTCESTAYCHYGYDGTGICLPLGNYHNMDESRRRIGPEYIDIRDFINLVKWFVALADSPRTLPYQGRHPGLGQRLESLLRQHRPRLLKTAAAIQGNA